MAADAEAGISVSRPDDDIEVIETATLVPVEYEWGAIKWICDAKITPESTQSFGYAYVLPGKTNPEHSHNSCEEIIYMLSGELDVCFDGGRTKVRPGQTAVIPKGLHHSVVNEGWEPVVYVASFSAMLRDTEFYGDTGELDDGDFR
jgi:quercetin dioxygenase-like cupin family protein